MQSLSVICRGTEVPPYPCYSQWIVGGLVVIVCSLVFGCLVTVINSLLYSVASLFSQPFFN